MIRRISKIRSWWRGVVLIAILSAAWLKLPVSFCTVRLGMLQMVCPVGFIESCLSTKSIITGLLPGVLLVGFLTVMTGKSFCAWACPARFAGKLARDLGNKKMPGPARKAHAFFVRFRSNVRSRLNLSWADGLALLSGLFIGILLFEFPAYSIFCPVGVLSRNLIELVAHFRLRFDLLFLMIPLAVGFLFNLGWKCACPTGLIRGLMSKPNRTLLPAVNHDGCHMCGKCMDNCTFGVRLHKNGHDSFACSKCLNCLTDCKHNAVSLKILPR